MPVDNSDKKITYWVRYDPNQSLGADLSTSLGKVTNNGSISIEEVITGHSRLPGHSSRNNHNFRSLQGILKNARPATGPDFFSLQFQLKSKTVIITNKLA